MAEKEDLARSAAERLSEDESLRGDLSDVGFGPLLDWGIAAAQAYNPKAKDAAAMDTYTTRLRGVIQSAVETAQAGKLDDPAPLLDFETDHKDKLKADLTALKLGDDPDANAQQIATALQAALTAAPAPVEQPATTPTAEDDQKKKLETSHPVESVAPPPAPQENPGDTPAVQAEPGVSQTKLEGTPPLANPPQPDPPVAIAQANLVANPLSFVKNWFKRDK